MTATADPDRRTLVRTVLTHWLVPLLAVALTGTLIAAAGGFETARGVDGPSVEPDELIDLARWEITVHEAELVNTTVAGSPSDTKIRLHLTVTLTGDASEFTLPLGLVSVVADDGTAGEDGYDVRAGDDWGSALDPGVTTAYTVNSTWPIPDEDFVQPPITHVPQTVTVVVRDEEIGGGRLFGPSWALSDVAAVVTLPLTDARADP